MSPDGRLLAAGAFNGTISILDAVTLETTGNQLTGGTAFALRLRFSGDSSMLFSAGLDNRLSFWDVVRR